MTDTLVQASAQRLAEQNRQMRESVGARSAAVHAPRVPTRKSAAAAKKKGKRKMKRRRAKPTERSGASCRYAVRSSRSGYTVAGMPAGRALRRGNTSRARLKLPVRATVSQSTNSNVTWLVNGGW